jgi:hypothetical protein
MDLLSKSRLYATDISTKLDKSKKESILMTLKNIPQNAKSPESIFCF